MPDTDRLLDLTIPQLLRWRVGETPDKVALRRSEGCITVEMEAAAFFAVAQFRDVEFAQMLYGGDDVSGDEWNSRKWQKHEAIREELFWLAAEACLLM